VEAGVPSAPSPTRQTVTPSVSSTTGQPPVTPTASNPAVTTPPVGSTTTGTGAWASQPFYEKITKYPSGAESVKYYEYGKPVSSGQFLSDLNATLSPSLVGEGFYYQLGKGGQVVMEEPGGKTAPTTAQWTTDITNYAVSSNAGQQFFVLGGTTPTYYESGKLVSQQKFLQDLNNTLTLPTGVTGYSYGLNAKGDTITYLEPGGTASSSAKFYADIQAAEISANASKPFWEISTSTGGVIYGEKAQVVSASQFVKDLNAGLPVKGFEYGVASTGQIRYGESLTPQRGPNRPGYVDWVSASKFYSDIQNAELKAGSAKQFFELDTSTGIQYYEHGKSVTYSTFLKDLNATLPTSYTSLGFKYAVDPTTGAIGYVEPGSTTPVPEGTWESDYTVALVKANASRQFFVAGGTTPTYAEYGKTVSQSQFLKDINATLPTSFTSAGFTYGVSGGALTLQEPGGKQASMATQWSSDYTNYLVSSNASSPFFSLSTSAGMQYYEHGKSVTSAKYLQDLNATVPTPLQSKYFFSLTPTGAVQYNESFLVRSPVRADGENIETTAVRSVSSSQFYSNLQMALTSYIASQPFLTVNPPATGGTAAVTATPTYYEYGKQVSAAQYQADITAAQIPTMQIGPKGQYGMFFTSVGAAYMGLQGKWLEIDTKGNIVGVASTQAGLPYQWSSGVLAGLTSAGYSLKTAADYYTVITDTGTSTSTYYILSPQSWLATPTAKGLSFTFAPGGTIIETPLSAVGWTSPFVTYPLTPSQVQQQQFNASPIGQVVNLVSGAASTVQGDINKVFGQVFYTVALRGAEIKSLVTTGKPLSQWEAANIGQMTAPSGLTLKQASTLAGQDFGTLFTAAETTVVLSSIGGSGWTVGAETTTLPGAVTAVIPGTGYFLPSATIVGGGLFVGGLGEAMSGGRLSFSQFAQQYTLGAGLTGVLVPVSEAIGPVLSVPAFGAVQAGIGYVTGGNAVFGLGASARSPEGLVENFLTGAGMTVAAEAAVKAVPGISQVFAEQAENASFWGRGIYEVAAQSRLTDIVATSLNIGARESLADVTDVLGTLRGIPTAAIGDQLSGLQFYGRGLYETLPDVGRTAIGNVGVDLGRVGDVFSRANLQWGLFDLTSSARAVGATIRESSFADFLGGYVSGIRGAASDVDIGLRTMTVEAPIRAWGDFIADIKLVPGAVSDVFAEQASNVSFYARGLYEALSLPDMVSARASAFALDVRAVGEDVFATPLRDFAADVGGLRDVFTTANLRAFGSSVAFDVRAIGGVFTEPVRNFADVWAPGLGQLAKAELETVGTQAYGYLLEPTVVDVRNTLADIGVATRAFTEPFSLGNVAFWGRGVYEAVGEPVVSGFEDVSGAVWGRIDPWLTRTQADLQVQLAAIKNPAYQLAEPGETIALVEPEVEPVEPATSDFNKYVDRLGAGGGKGEAGEGEGGVAVGGGAGQQSVLITEPLETATAAAKTVPTALAPTVSPGSAYEYPGVYVPLTPYSWGQGEAYTTLRIPPGFVAPGPSTGVFGTQLLSIAPLGQAFGALPKMVMPGLGDLTTPAPTKEDEEKRLAMVGTANITDLLYGYDQRFRLEEQTKQDVDIGVLFLYDTKVAQDQQQQFVQDYFQIPEEVTDQITRQEEEGEGIGGGLFATPRKGKRKKEGKMWPEFGFREIRHPLGDLLGFEAMVRSGSSIWANPLGSAKKRSKR
jgi:hypothetical protein